jgi:hypothetical protein
MRMELEPILLSYGIGVGVASTGPLKGVGQAGEGVSPAAIPMTGALSGMPATEPKKVASPNANTPAPAPVSQWPGRPASEPDRRWVD